MFNIKNNVKEYISDINSYSNSGGRPGGFMMEEVQTPKNIKEYPLLPTESFRMDILDMGSPKPSNFDSAVGIGIFEQIRRSGKIEYNKSIKHNFDLFNKPFGVDTVKVILTKRIEVKFNRK